jgi:saccharopine dehydrogenase-like NADP-dependent oxidoreductase
MKNVLILGANGAIARCAIDLLLAHTDNRLTLYLRNARRLKHVDPSRKSVAALVVTLVQSPELEVRRSLGVSKPE